ncbi:DoxX family protein [Nocardia vermiculata]|uniref:DoxX family protein n=1 Tax=Nocardia vermiculata TaxID=257274 RepID=UPI000A4B785E|nr:DoxX family protein [Nocardia vermiculata]
MVDTRTEAPQATGEPTDRSGSGANGLPDDGAAVAARWNPVTRLAFRFAFLYFGLFCLIYPQIIFAFTGWFANQLDVEAVAWQPRLLQPILEWVGATVFGIHPVLHFGGSGDQSILWVLVFCILVVAAVGTLIWTVLDRRRPGYPRAAGWFLIFIRLCLGAQMLNYGFAKVIPTQMPEPTLVTLLQPYGELTPMSVLWNQVGSSPTYEILLGAAELLAGVLLFIPRTATAGALLSLVAMAQVFVLNMTFDVPVKLLSGHLLLMSMVLLVPQARRLLGVLLLDRAVGPSTAPYPFRTRRSRMIGAAAQLAVGLWVGAALVDVSAQMWEEGPGREEPPLYGIWQVEEFARDGDRVPPLLTDPVRWQRVVFDFPGVMHYQRMDGTMGAAQVKVDTEAHRVALSAAAPDAAAATTGDFGYEQQGPDRLSLTGELDGHPVTVTFHRQDPDAFPLRSTGFHWVQDEPGY